MLQVVQEVNGRVGVSKELKIEETTAPFFLFRFTCDLCLSQSTHCVNGRWHVLSTKDRLLTRESQALNRGPK